MYMLDPLKVIGFYSILKRQLSRGWKKAKNRQGLLEMETKETVNGLRLKYKQSWENAFIWREGKVYRKR